MASAARSPEEFEHDLRPLRQLAHDVVEHVRRHGGRSGRRGLGGDGVGDFKIEIGRLQAERRALGAQQHIGENRNGVAPLDRAMHMPERAQQLGTLNSDFHRNIRSRGWGMIASEHPLSCAES